MFRFLPVAACSLTPIIFGNVHSFSESAKSPLDCDKPACADTIDMFKKAMKTQKRNSSSSQNTGAIPVIPKQYKGCPAGKAQLGRNSWLLLHTMAANYPDEPTEEQQLHATQFITALSQLYPCPHCAEDFQKSIASNPPRVKSRKEFSVWLCEQHNEVNVKLGKPVFPCNIDLVDLRWRDGEDSCWEDDDDNDDDDDDDDEK